MAMKAIRPKAPGATPEPVVPAGRVGSVANAVAAALNSPPTPAPILSSVSTPAALATPAAAKPELQIATPIANTNFPSPVQFPVLSAFCRDLSDELGKVLGIVTGVIDYGAHSGNAETALEASASVTMATDFALTLSRNLTFIQGLLSGERLFPTKSDVAQLLMDTYMLNQKYLTHRQTMPSLVVDKSCMAEVDPNAVHHVVCTLLVRAGKNIQPGGTVTVQLNQHQNEVEIVHTETLNPQPLNLNDTELAVCKMLLEAHGGRFEASSENGATKFSMHFPAPNGVEISKGAVNKRRHRRARAKLPVDFKFANGFDEIATHTVNISVNGVMLAYPPDKFKVRPTVGQEISLKIHCSRDRALEVPKARVAATLNHAFGIEFIEIDDKTRRILNGIVKSRPY